jgi:hypothetical protein
MDSLFCFSARLQSANNLAALFQDEDGPMVPGIDMEFPKKMKAIQQLLGIPPCIETSIYIHIYTYVYIYIIYI